MSTIVYSLYTLSRKIKVGIVNMNEACADVPKLFCLRMAANSAEK
jgi:hypothetical protein